MTRTLSSLALVVLLVALGSVIPAQNAPRAARTAPAPVYALPVVVGVTPAPSVAPAASGGVGTALIGGFATWYADPKQPPDSRYAAAGPLLRDALGDWRGRTIRVTSGKHSTLTTLIDFCACGDRNGTPTVLDLSPASFADLGSLDAGLIRVEIEIAVLPATDANPRTPDDLRMMLEVRGDELYR